MFESECSVCLLTGDRCASALSCLLQLVLLAPAHVEDSLLFTGVKIAMIRKGGQASSPSLNF